MDFVYIFTKWKTQREKRCSRSHYRDKAGRGTLLRLLLRRVGELNLPGQASAAGNSHALWMTNSVLQEVENSTGHPAVFLVAVYPSQ